MRTRLGTNCAGGYEEWSTHKPHVYPTHYVPHPSHLPQVRDGVGVGPAHLLHEGGRPHQHTVVLLQEERARQRDKHLHELRDLANNSKGGGDRGGGGGGHGEGTKRTKEGMRVDGEIIASASSAFLSPHLTAHSAAFFLMYGLDPFSSPSTSCARSRAIS